MTAIVVDHKMLAELGNRYLRSSTATGIWLKNGAAAYWYVLD